MYDFTIPVNTTRLYEFTIPIKKCARCGRSHDEITFYKMRNSSWWFGDCPRTHQPILAELSYCGEKIA